MLKLRKAYWFLPILILTIGLSQHAQSAQINVYVEVDAARLHNAWTQPIVQLLPAENLTGQRQNEHGAWMYLVKIGNNLVTPLVIDLQGEIPEDFSFTPLHFAPPFTEKDSIFVIRLAPIQTEGEAQDARKIYATNVNAISDDQLPVFYQYARAVANARVEKLAENWLDLHSYDVQVVFKYLEAVREMTKKTYVLPPEDIDKMKDWLKKAIDNNSQRVSKAVGLNNAKLLIEQTDLNEALRFGKLWRLIKNIDDCQKRYPLLLAYYTMLSEIPAGERQTRIKAETGVYAATILASMAECVSFNIRCYPDTIANPLVSLTELIEQLADEKDRTLQDDLKNLLESTIKALSGLKIDLEQQHPLLCPEREP